ncbi:hypothetical protein SGLAD_v1c07050 [Spiroplasma gladiatoris]|uniref:Uncharacterized protein n=1 Tax=Spiroplasma gladiatoris TaxID=2143 RepID=A0A4P7AHI1_9MOLU|nr:hypothetical protein [Spiroplasma gladiatoris]QBQ07904.1 hypothetical protein SGLAD_v1c07050 [Spiroplasma gladiatoris]
MKGITSHIFLAFFLIATLFLSLFIIKKQNIYWGNYFIQDKLNDKDMFEKKIYVLVEQKINIDSIVSIKVEYKSGYRHYDKKFLKFESGILQLQNIDIEGLDQKNNKVLLYGSNSNLLNYLLSNLK